MLIDDIPSLVTYEYTGVRTFSIGFPFYGTESVRVGFRAGDAPILTPYKELVKNTDFTVTGVRAGANDSEIAFISGKVVLTDLGAAKLSIGDTIVVNRDTPVSQLYAYNEYDNFPAKSHENALGRLTTVAQELAKKISASITIPPGSYVSGEEVLNDVFMAADQASASAAASKASATTSSTEANRAKTEANRAKTEADRSATQANQSTVQANRSAAEADRAEAAAARSMWRPGMLVPTAGTKLYPNCVWPDRSLVLFADWPDLAAEYYNGYIMATTQANAPFFPGYWIINDASTGLYLPDIGGLFPRAWRAGTMKYDVGRAAGHYQADAQQPISGSFKVGTVNWVVPFTGATGALVSGGGTTAYMNNPNSVLGVADYIMYLDSARQVRTAPENRSQNYSQPVATYLGRHKSEI